MTLLQIMILAVIQGLAELLPVSSSAHVIAAAKLMGLQPSSPAFTLMLVMLHTGTMFAVIVYFWNAWKVAFFSTPRRFARAVRTVIVATVATGIVGGALVVGIQEYQKHQNPAQDKAEIEGIFDHLEIMAPALAAVGLLILYAGLNQPAERNEHEEISSGNAFLIGVVQGLALPFRGFSRSGSTISAGLLCGIPRLRVEEFSFALAVVLTPAVVAREAWRLVRHHAPGATPIGLHDFVPSLLGMVLSFFAGLLALKLLSQLLVNGKWWVFGVYCLAASAGLYAMYHAGY
jgi:undecaprenyl-diphosphatase